MYAIRSYYGLAEEQGLTLIPPFDDVDVIAGQGTIGRELLEQDTRLTHVFVPTARTWLCGTPRNRWPNRSRHAMARSATSGAMDSSGSRPSASP